MRFEVPEANVFEVASWTNWLGPADEEMLERVGDNDPLERPSAEPPFEQQGRDPVFERVRE